MSPSLHVRVLTRAVAVACALVGMGLAAPAVATEQASTGPDDTATTSSTSTPPAAYTDQLIPAAELPADSDDAGMDDDSSGLPRGLHLDLGIGWHQQDGRTDTERGVSVGGWRDTLDWGSWSLDARAWQGSSPRSLGGTGNGALFTVWQRGFYVDGGWRGDTGFGVLNTPQLPLMREQARLFLPSTPFAGLSSDWRSPQGDLRWQASYGQPGYFTGGRVTGFERGEGHVASAGVEWAPAGGWRVAADWLGSDLTVRPTSLTDSMPIYQAGPTSALYAAAAWTGVRDRVQANLLGSDVAGTNASGLWLDAQSRRGRWRHDYGLYRLGDGLGFGPLPMSNNAEGAYYRASYGYARWQWSTGVDALQQLRGDGFAGIYATTFVRYQASTRLGVGGNLALRQGRGDDAASASVFADHGNAFGQTRWQLDVARDDGGRRDWRLGVDQALPMNGGRRVSLSLAWEQHRDPLAALDGQGLVGAVYGGLDLGDRLRVDGSLRYRQSEGGSSGRGLDANLAFDWQINPRWHAIATFFQSQASSRQALIIDPLAPPLWQWNASRDRAVFLSLRYQRQAGRPAAVLAGPAGAPTGGIQGQVFLDANGNGQREANELPAAAVTVVLDGRFSVQTDAEGHFQFPRVAIGPHRVAVVSDNLPLPWRFADGADQRAIEVAVRHDTTLDFAASPPR